METLDLSLAQYERNPSGVLLMDGKEVAHTLQCCHCQSHFLSMRGSKKRRGFCTHCQSITCGQHKCDICIPFEEKLNLTDGTTTLDKSKYKDEVLLYGADGSKLM